MSWVAAAFRSVGVARGFLELGLCFFAATDFFMFFPWLGGFKPRRCSRSSMYYTIPASKLHNERIVVSDLVD